MRQHSSLTQIQDCINYDNFDLFKSVLDHEKILNLIIFFLGFVYNYVPPPKENILFLVRLLLVLA